MRNFFLLIKLQFLNLISGGKGGKKGKQKPKTSSMIPKVAIVLLLGGICFLVSYIYSDIFFKTSLIEASSLPVLMLTLASIICFMFNFYSAGAVLFNNKDYDLLSSLPIRKSSIIISKLTLIYVASFLISLIFVIPSFIVLSANGVAVTISCLLRTFIMVVFAPLMIITLGVLIGTTMQVLFAKSKYKNLFQTVSLVLVFILIMALSLLLDGGNLLVITKLYFLYPIAVNGLYGWIDVLIFVAINLGAFALIVTAVCLLYSKINTLLKTGYKNKKFRLGTYQESSKIKAIYKKEFKRLFTVPMYFLNVIIGPIMSLVVAITFSVLVSDITKGDAIMNEFLIIVLSAVLLFTHMSTPSTNSAISIEGKRFWIIKSLPIEEKHILRSKLSVNLAFNGLSAIISSTIVCIFIVPNVYYGLIVFALAVGGGILAGTVGLLLNLRFPKFDWENANQVVKNSLPVFLSMIISLPLCVLAVLPLVTAFIPPVIYMGILAGLVIIANVVAFIILKKLGIKMLRKIEM